MSKAKKDMTLEEAFAQLEGTIQALEGEDISLEESFQKYKQGMDALQYCNSMIDQVEKKVLVLEGNGELDEL